MKLVAERPNPKDVDWARLAAYVDGEGSINICHQNSKQHGHKRYGYIVLTIGNTDPRLIKWLKDTFGGCATWHGSKSRTSRAGIRSLKPLYAWIIYGKRAQAMLLQFCEYLVIKREQADLAIAYQDLQVGQQFGRAGLPIEVTDQRTVLETRLKETKREVVAAPADLFTRQITERYQLPDFTKAAN